MPPSLIKPFQTYSQQIQLLKDRGMIIEKDCYAEKKLTQVGYYRLSGYWYTLRKFNPTNTGSNQTSHNVFTEEFLDEICFEDVYKLYIFDKKIRLLIFDIIERLEIHIKNVLGHTLSEIDPLCYRMESFIDPKQWKHYIKWLKLLYDNVDRSKENFITHHTKNNKEIPCWVITDIWDFGTLSKFFSLLKGKYKTQIANVFIPNYGYHSGEVLEKWLKEINLLRNLSAHHMRIWNRYFPSEIYIPENIDFFESVPFSKDNKKKLFPRLCVLWYLISNTTTNYSWGEKIVELLELKKPNLPTTDFSVMGIPQDFMINDIRTLFTNRK